MADSSSSKQETDKYKYEEVKNIKLGSSETPLVSVKKNKPDLRKKEPPLVDLKVSNPLTYLKSWWKRIIGNEGIEFRIKIRPLTAIAISIIIFSISFGIGRFILPFKIPFFEYTVGTTPSPSPSIERDTAFSGILRYSRTEGRFYLEIVSAEAIILEVSDNIQLSSFVGRRIFATGTYNKDTRVLVVTEATDLEVLPKEAVTVPTTKPTNTPVPSPTITPTPENSSSPTPTITPTPTSSG